MTSSDTAATPRYPDVSIEVHVDGDTGVIRSRVHKALASAAGHEVAEQYLVETKPLCDYPAQLLEHTRAWVTVSGDAGDLPQRKVSALAAHAPLAEPLGEDGGRWQYAVVNVGMFNSPDRMASVLAVAGANGWELVSIYDKSSNWFQGFEKGFMLLKRPVPEGVTPSSWCVNIRG